LPARPGRHRLLSGSCSSARNFAPRFLPTLGRPHAVALHFTHCDQLVTGLAPVRVRPCWAHNKSAVSHYRTAADLYRGLGDRMNLAHAVRHVADILRGMGRTAEAEPEILEAIAIYRAQEPLPPLHLANALRVAALLKEQAGSNAEAMPLWVEARDRYSALQSKNMIRFSTAGESHGEALIALVSGLPPASRRSGICEPRACGGASRATGAAAA
jgi:tetratricopeptide (TPR) repeat protein